MKHAREDYNRIQDPDNKIPADEPVFLLRGQDELAARTVDFYATLCREKGLDAMARVTRKLADDIRAWPTKKTPDL